MSATKPMTLLGLLRSLQIHLGIVLLFAAVLAAVLWQAGYLESFRVLHTRLRYPLLDTLMPHLTHLGDGLVVYAMLVALLVRRDPALALSGLVTLLLMGTLVQILKNTYFEEWYRPWRYFAGHPEVHFLGPRLVRNAFPSGHTMSVMTAGMFLAYGYRSYAGYLQALLALAICVVAYTRIYIGAHFPGDVLASTVLGVVASLAVLWGVYPRWAHRVEETGEAQWKGWRWVQWLAVGVMLCGFLLLLWL